MTTKEEWKNFIQNKNLKYKKEQENFYKRTTEFLNSNNTVLVNPAGMGLGKTLATTKAIKEHINNYELFCIVNPTSPLKKVWAENLNETDLKGKYIIWFSKEEMCIKKKVDKKFNIDQCKSDEDCEYRKSLEEWDSEDGQNYTEECKHLTEELCSELPITVDNYYDKYGTEKCLLPITRYGLKNKEIIVGDFFAFLKPKMFKLVTKRDTNKSICVVDEAHLLPERAKAFLSKSISFDITIKHLQEEIYCDYIRKDIKKRAKFLNTIKTLEKIRENLLIVHKQKDEKRYTYSNFKNDYENLKENNSIEFDELYEELRELRKYGSFEEENPHCEKFAIFLEHWRNKELDPNYSQYFQYSMRYGGKIRFFINCQNTKEYILHCLKHWEKTVLNSGTITNLDYFKLQTGIEEINTKVENHIESYSIKDNIIVYPVGSFVNAVRHKTYEKNKQLIQELIKNLTGRTIIFIQSKRDSIILEKQLNDIGINVVNFCQKDDGFETSKEDFEKCLHKFSKINNGVALMNITGRVEGYNFKNHYGESVSNIIIYGYPYPRRGLLRDDELVYYTNTLGNRSDAIKYVDYVPVLDRIYQACFRAKRRECDKPIIILWGMNFGKGNFGYKYMPDDMKGDIYFTPTELKTEVVKRENERRLIIQ